MNKNRSASVVIVGRTNVGKSTLFNRLAQNVRSITLDYAGVTRDFLRDQISWKDVSIDLIDSGGINLRKSQDEITQKVQSLVLNLLESTDAIIFMVDGVVGLLPEDREISKYLHKLGKPVIIAVNKIDSKTAQEHLHEFDKLGHQNLVTISAQHGVGINDLLDIVVNSLPKVTKQVVKKEEPLYKVVFLGKPNVGKSSLMNLLLKEERSIVSNVPGTTREAISENISYYQETIKLTDTPGIRRQRSVKEELETLMVKSSFAALKNSDIVVLLIDGTQSALVDQELKLAHYAFTEHYKSLILLINKADLMTDLNRHDLEYNFELYKYLIKKIPVLYISCKDGKNVGKVLPLVQKVWLRYSETFDNAEINKLIIGSLHKKPLYHQSQPLRVYKAEQIRTAPPTILLTVNEPDWFGPSQLGFFDNILRSKYNMVGVPIKFILKRSRDE